MSELGGRLMVGLCPLKASILVRVQAPQLRPESKPRSQVEIGYFARDILIFIKNMDTPRYEYSRSKIQDRIEYLKNLSAPYGLIVRYAVKANPHKEIVGLMNNANINFDASSSYEAEELLSQGISGTKISLSSQQSPHNIDQLLDAGVLFVATSIKQLELFLEAKNHPKTVGVRVNPNIGSGHNNRTSTGGVNASFGIWYEYLNDVKELAKSNNVIIDRIHLHVGSGSDPSVWDEIIDRALLIVENLKDVISLDIGGGFKVHRFGNEKETNMTEIFEVFTNKLVSFYGKTGRKLKLEIEPGTYFVAHAGTLIASVDDIVDTGSNGYTFLKLNTGMNDFLRTAMYGANHVIEVMNKSENIKRYIVVGHNCESGDIFTTISGNSEEIEPRILKEARIGDEIRIYDTGAYCASMRVKSYNSFPDAIEVVVD